MRTYGAIAFLTILNLATLAFVSTQNRSVKADEVAPVLRGHKLEIVDDQGKVRASIQVVPAGPARRLDGSLVEGNGKTYPEAVLLRLIRPDGRPSVKIETTEQGSALDLGGGMDPTYIVLNAQGGAPSLTLTDKRGRRQVMKP